MSTFWNFRGQSPVNTEDAARASYIARQKANMQGYAPQNMAGYAPSQEAPGMSQGVLMRNDPMTVNQQGGVRLPVDVQGALGTGEAYTRQQQQLQALKDEYDRNSARIAEIENELRTIEKTDRKRLDDLDTRLAENRAEIGDMGNAQMHLNRIDSRRLKDSEKASNLNKDMMADQDEIDRLYMMRAEGSPAQQAYYDRAIARKERAFSDKYGKEYGGSLQVPTGMLGSGDTVDNLPAFNQKMQSLRNPNGNLTDAGIAELWKDIEKLPQGEARNAAQKALDAEVSQEKLDANAKAERAKENAAIAEAKKAVSGWKLKSEGDTQTYTAKNGKTVTLTRTNGGVRYTCGKSEG